MSASIFTVLDDIAILADDIAVAAKTGTAKAAGILGDDIAVGAKKATGFSDSRELQVIYKIMKGSFINKLIIIPFVFLLNFIYPPLIVYTLIFGAFYLAFEGAEGVHHWFAKKNENHEEDEDKSISEDEKVKGAIKTDFILSIEIIIIALNSIKESSDQFMVQLGGTFLVGLLATVGVYGLVALIVRLDDMGFWFKRKGMNLFGDMLIASLPKIIKVLGVVGVIAMLMVAGGIFNHQIHYFHNDFGTWLTPMYDIGLGLIAGVIVLNLMILKEKFQSCCGCCVKQ